MIVREISAGQKRVNGRKIDTIQAIVRFPDGDTTRHLQNITIRNEKGEVVVGPGGWFGWNSDRALRVRQGILDTHATHIAIAKASETRFGDVESKLTGLKGKRGAEVTAERKRLRESLKAAKTTLATANADLAAVKAIADRVKRDPPPPISWRSRKDADNKVQEKGLYIS